MNIFHKLTVLIASTYFGLFASPGYAKTLEVGNGKPFDNIEKANAAAEPGDTILVHPLEKDRPYEKTALFVNPAKNDDHLAKQSAEEAKTTLTIDDLAIPPVLIDPSPNTPAPLAWQYRHPAEKEKRINEKELNFGAYGE